MTAQVGEIRSHDRVSPVTKTFTHSNGTDTNLELWIGGKLGKYRLPIEVQLLTPAATYQLEYNELDRDGAAMSDTIATTADALPIVLAACPHRIKAASTDNAVLICRY